MELKPKEKIESLIDVSIHLIISSQSVAESLKFCKYFTSIYEEWSSFIPRN
jgi:hypothetical protein